jgi:hypothetical protein
MNLSNGNHVNASNNAPRMSGAIRTMSRKYLRRGGRENGREQSHPFLFAVGFLTACRIAVIATRRSTGSGYARRASGITAPCSRILQTPKNANFRFRKQGFRQAEIVLVSN